MRIDHRLPQSKVQAFIEEAKRLDGADAQWRVTDSLELDFDTHHPQGLVKIEDTYYLSSVKKKGWFRKGKGYLFKFNSEGKLLDQIELGQGKQYHPGGIDFDGEKLWVSVAEYKPESSTTVYSVDPETMKAEAEFEVDDHIGALTRDPETGHLHGATWDSESLMTWTVEGEKLKHRVNRSTDYGYQDWKSVGDGLALASGVKRRRGGVELVELDDGERLAQLPIKLRSSRNRPMTQNPMTFRFEGDNIQLFVVPDDDRSKLYELSANFQ